jgi:hypothetical protein
VTNKFVQLYRVLGAVIIVAGLYLVVWGKSKDYKSQTPSTNGQTALDLQIIHAGNTGKENFDHEVVTIDVSGVETNKQEEKQRTPVTC